MEQILLYDKINYFQSIMFMELIRGYTRKRPCSIDARSDGGADGTDDCWGKIFLVATSYEGGGAS